MIRAIISSVIEGVVKRFSGSGRPDETLANREYFQHYGFTSRPKAGAEGIVIFKGNHFIMIASEDRRYRVGIEEGEVCLYTDEGDKIHLKRGREIRIQTGGKLTVEAANEVNVTAAVAAVNASTQAQVISPSVLLGAQSGHQGLLNEAFQTLYSSHTHGSSPIPNQQAGESHRTGNVKGT